MYHVHGPTLEMIMHTMDSNQMHSSKSSYQYNQHTSDVASTQAFSAAAPGNCTLRQRQTATPSPNNASSPTSVPTTTNLTIPVPSAVGVNVCTTTNSITSVTSLNTSGSNLLSSGPATGGALIIRPSVVTRTRICSTSSISGSLGTVSPISITCSGQPAMPAQVGISLSRCFL
ncbi:unnamed protein product [Protopolystoma xenopodis]|uniref:Uncharacterized protein n=1 Tax=Protopolystoma xenopodis TaxID=117903 RepID=A0A3S5CUV0_9PLAT|nr:unnamed protein product [Protopolystoma xenopodis]